MNFELFLAKVKIQWGKCKAFCMEYFTKLKKNPKLLTAVVSVAVVVVVGVPLTLWAVLSPAPSGNPSDGTVSSESGGSEDGNDTLKESVGLEYSVNSDGITCTITGIGTCKDVVLAIPEKIDGYKVTSIGESSFQGCGSLTSIDISDSVTSIGAFAFEKCSSLTSVKIGNGVTDIGFACFRGCSSLIDITVSIDNESYQSIDGNLYNLRGAAFMGGIMLQQYAIGKTDTSFKIPDGVVRLGSSAFSDCDNLTSVIIGNEVTDTGTYVFSDCSNLTSVTIENGLTRLEEGTFFGCGSLTSITFNGSQAEWAALKKHSGWNYSSQVTTIHCTDGDLTL